jgi:antitoxin (DNA-binding transcriptional repressor) of toxin-antitoxin stability system
MLVCFQTGILVCLLLNSNQSMIKVNIQEAKTHLSRYLDQVENGDVVVLCRHNQPVAELRAIRIAPAHPARVAGLLKGRVDFKPGAFAPMTAEELAEFDGAPLPPGVEPV